MRRQTGINVGLLALIIVLCIIALYSDDQTIPTPTLLSALDRDNIKHIKIIRQDLDDLVFSKENKQWFMRSPLQYQTNIKRLDSLLKLLAIESHSQLDVATVELDQFNLTESGVSLMFDDHLFQFGNTDPINGRRYVLFNDQIHLIDDFIYHQLTTNAAFYLSPRLVAADFKIQSIAFPDRRINFVDDRWQALPPVTTKADKLKSLVQYWQNVIAISVSQYTPKEAAYITLIASDGRVLELIIVSTDPHLVLARADIGIQYHFGSDQADKLLLSDDE